MSDLQPANGDETARARSRLEKKLQLVRDLVPAVAKGFKTGLFLYGSGGVGKSYTVYANSTNPLPQEARRTQRRNILREILRQTEKVEEQVQLYVEQTGASRADFYRRKSEVLSWEFDEHDMK